MPKDGSQQAPFLAASRRMAALTLPRLLLAAGLIAIGAMAARYAADSDTWWHLATGRWIVAHGQIPGIDIFSYTQAGADWRIPGWPAQLLLHGVYSIAGDLGLSALAALVVVGAFAAVAAAAPGEQPFVRVVVLLFAAVVSSIYWAARPALFSLLFAALYVLLLREPLAKRALILIPALMVVWANTHGGFAIGFILIALAAGGHGLRWVIGRGADDARAVLRLALIGMASAAAACLNPYGVEMLAYPFKTAGLQALGLYIQEWQPLDPGTPLGMAFVGWLAVTALAALANWKRVDLPALALFAGTAAMALTASRHVPLAALTGVPVLTAALSDLASRVRSLDGLGRRPGSPALNVVVLGVVALMAAVRWLASSTPAALPINSPMRPPTAAVAAMAEQDLPGPIFNSYDFGGYLIWALPEHPTFVDGRTDLYPVELFSDYVTVERGGADALVVLNRYGVRTAIVRNDTPASDLLAASPDWRVVHIDDVAAVYTQR